MELQNIGTFSGLGASVEERMFLSALSFVPRYEHSSDAVEAKAEIEP